MGFNALFGITATAGLMYRTDGSRFVSDCQMLTVLIIFHASSQDDAAAVSIKQPGAL